MAVQFSWLFEFLVFKSWKHFMLIVKRVFGMKGGGLLYFDNQNSFFGIAMWIVIQFWFHSGLFLLKTIPPPPFCSHNGLGMTDYVLMKYPRHCCNKFVPKNKIDYLNFHFHIEKNVVVTFPFVKRWFLSLTFF